MRYRLTPEGINAAVSEVENYLNDRKKNAKDILRVRIGVEEALLRYQEQFGEDKEFFIKCGKSFGRTKVSVTVPGTMFDPFAQPGNAESGNAFMRMALASMGDLPAWKYFNGSNVIYFTVSREMLPEWTHLTFAVVSAVVLGTLLQFASADIRVFVRDDLLSPVLDTFMNMLGGVAGPMIFLAIVWGIYSIGDAATFSALGKHLAIRYIFYTTLLTLLLFVGILPFLTFVFGSTQGEGNAFRVIFQMVLQVVPGNIIEPFSTGNTLQILFLGIVVGIAMIFISEKTQTVAIFAEQLNYIVQIIMDFISKLVPLFVFGSLMNIILGNGFDSLKSTYKLFLFNIIAFAALVLFDTLLVAVRMKLSPIVFWKKAFETFLIALTTASSSAAFATNISTCRERFGVQENLTNFAVPFGQIVFKPAVSLTYLITVLYMAEVYQVPISFSWMATAVFMSVLLSSATPPIPGGTLASYSILFAQLGIPMEGIAVVITLDVILDFISTPVNIFSQQAMLILAAKKARRIDEDVLHDRVKIH